jgi:hypothetical protein
MTRGELTEILALLPGAEPDEWQSKTLFKFPGARAGIKLLSRIPPSLLFSTPKVSANHSTFYCINIANQLVFGGQVVGLALRAATQSVDPSKLLHVHSLHSYFVLPGNNEVPITFRVQRVRTGRSFVTRSVRALQEGKVIFVMVPLPTRNLPVRWLALQPERSRRLPIKS